MFRILAAHYENGWFGAQPFSFAHFASNNNMAAITDYFD